MISVDHPSGRVLLGHTEVRVPSGSGAMFAAPSLIWHYVTAHSYRPPAEFIKAVEQYDQGWTSDASHWIPHDAVRTTFN
ncbi:hypothetical protein ACN27J_21955 [Solwaraspora sp. WMMB762]|uniref:DUF7919 family protein n=1 Tax=Solwaraspora sp. WMMB762 TaxID=3404120 RepID=UPI003B9420F7